MATSRWEDEDFKAQVRAAYLETEPTPETNSEILQQMGLDFEVSPNSLRVFLAKENLLAKKVVEPTAEGAKSATTGTKRVSKEKVIGQLKDLIASKDKPVDNDILDKLTGKAAQYLIEVIS